MMGKRKRTYEESTEEKGQNQNQAINAMTINAPDDWLQTTEPKGSAEQWVIDQTVEDIETVRLKNERIIVEADQDSSIADIQMAVARARDGYGVAIEQSRVGDSISNRRVKRAIQDFKGLTRTL